ncbi:MAG: hypothetical protein P8171_26030 [Candidatus Thiodiazotropha sp.]|jgi:hypothetical protein
MEWSKFGNTAVHQSGFALSVDHGTFAMPYEVNACSTEGLSPAYLVPMNRLGLAYAQESRAPQPRVAVRKRRQIG